MSLLRFIARYLYAPLFFVGFIGSAIYLVHMEVSKLWLAALLFSAIAMSFLAERVLPFEKVWTHAKGDGLRDFLHANVNEISSGLSVAAIPVIASLGHGFDLWPSHWPLWGQLAGAILVVDCGITLAHFASHRIQVLWRLHAVHHSVERMYGFNGLMKHPLHQAIEMTVGTDP